MNTHTPEPWVAHFDHVETTDRELLAVVYGEDGGVSNAARIVACVNLLAGIELPEQGQLSKQNAHLYMGKEVFAFSFITNKPRKVKLDWQVYAEFMKGSKDVAELYLPYDK